MGETQENLVTPEMDEAVILHIIFTYRQKMLGQEVSYGRLPRNSKQG